MVSNYEKFDEQKRAYTSRADEIEFIYTKKLLDKYIKPADSVIELGCGTGYYGIYLADKCAGYHGVDLVTKHIKTFDTIIKERQLTNLSASVGDATDLAKNDSGSFDVVLVFGPMYHLPPTQRAEVMRESTRLCRQGGVIMFAYINKTGAYIRVCLDKALNENYPNKTTNEYVLQREVDDILPDVFFFTMPEDIEREATSQGLRVLQNSGVDFAFNASEINGMSVDKYAAWIQIMDCMHESESCTGASNHAVLVCQKPREE